MTEITPEMIAVVARGMGYEYHKYASFEEGKELFAKNMILDEYNPIENPSQLLEIMEKLKICIMPHDIEIFWEAYLGYKGKIYEATGKTINEAVVLAAYNFYNGGA